VNASVLIADGNGARGTAIAAACGELGIASKVVPHGAAALETALSELPAVLVVDRELPLIDAEQLADILRANPRTQSVRMIFLGFRAGAGKRAEKGVQALGASVPPADVAESVRALLEERQQIAPAEASAAVEATGGVEGELAQLPLTDLLQLFHVSRKTGAVKLTHRDRGKSEKGRVLLSGGDVIHAEVGPIAGEKALFRMIGWERGSFVFRPERVAIEPSVKTPTLVLLREGRRQLEEWERLAPQLPPMDAYATLKIQGASLPNVIHPLTQEVLMVLESYSQIRDVVDHCSYPDYQVLRILHTLNRRGMLSLRRDVPGPSGSSARTGLFSPNQAARLREWLQGHGATEVPMRDAKLVVAASSPGRESCREFARVIGRLPGVELAPRVAAGEVPSDELTCLGRIAVDGELGIEFVQVPVNSRFQPLWPIAADGALGILLLLTGPLSQAAESIRRIAGEFRLLPRSRVFYLMLLEKGARVTPEDLRENISLLDETSLFLVPQENDGKAGILLREMFGRIIP
jgi:CheY-like chemotaxis protein